MTTLQSSREKSDALKYRAFFENSNDAIILISWDRKIIELNQQTEELTGFSAEELVGESVNKLVIPEEWQDAAEKHQLLSSGVQIPVYERWIRRKDGTRFPVEINLFPVKDAEGQVLYLQSISRDISKRKAAENALLESERRYRALFEQSLDTILLTDLKGYIINANPSATLMLGYPYEELKGMHISMLSAPAQKDDTEARLELLLQGGSLSPYERIARRKDGTLFPVEVRVVLVRDEQGNPLYFQSTSHNITERKNIEKQLHHLATHDSLTGLPNRVLFFERLAQALERARQNRTKVAILFMDLDGFKEVNDTFGHAMGDQLLQAIAQRLEMRFRDVDTLARMGGDEFTLIFEEIVSLEQAIHLSERVLALMEMPFGVRGETLQIGASLGLSLFPDDGAEVEQLVSDADNAMYAAKHAGKARLVVHQALDSIKV
ncbi:MAG TPA: PAS domain S-box protein [Anaerolineales bacterium]|nr:PAS domain S-box protein [Anaerolineales bacterium]